MSEAAPRKPWYLVVALLLCLVGFGGCGATAAWGTIERYRGVQLEPPAADLAKEDQRKAATAAHDRWMAALDHERPRGFPLAVGELVLGLAVFFFASAAWMGRNGARRALVQLVAAQAALVVAAFFLTRASRQGAVDWQLTVSSAKAIDLGQPAAQVEQSMPITRVLFKGSMIAWLVVQSLLAVFVVISLTRPRALAYYAALNERPRES